MESQGIEHRTVQVNGINMHVAEKGNGPLILFVHGFPELWYSWRHQILALSDLGYRAVAPDLRGYGDTDAPSSLSSYTCLHMVGDLVALLDAIAPDQEQVFVVAHDWGALIAWYLCLFRPDRVKALVSLSVQFMPRNPQRKFIESLQAAYGDDYYICRFQEPGVIEAEFAQMGTTRVIKEFLTYRNPGPLFLPKGKGFGHPTDTPIVLPSWLSEDEVNYYAAKFDKTGFTGGINYYRNLDMYVIFFELMLSSVDDSKGESSGEVCCGRPGPSLQLSRCSGLHTQRRVQEICAASGRSSCIGRSCPFSATRKA
ncbi:unnamed protein product [Malus baccata var. baccata]